MTPSPTGPSEREPNDLWGQMRHITAKPPVWDHEHTHTHEKTHTHIMRSTCVWEHDRMFVSWGFCALETLTLCTWDAGCNISGYITKYFLMPGQSDNHWSQSSGWNHVGIGRGWIFRGPMGRRVPQLQTSPLSGCSSAPQDVTPFIMLLHATQLRLAAFFSYNQAFIRVLWWLSQTLEQTVAPPLALRWQEIRGGRLPPLPSDVAHATLCLHWDCVTPLSGAIQCNLWI